MSSEINTNSSRDHADAFANSGYSVTVVVPAMNEEKNLPHVLPRIPGWVSEVILVDGNSKDNTVAVARTLEGVQVHVHELNRGYGGNQKTCYRLALEAGAVEIDRHMAGQDIAHIPAAGYGAGFAGTEGEGLIAAPDQRLDARRDQHDLGGGRPALSLNPRNEPLRDHGP